MSEEGDGCELRQRKSGLSININREGEVGPFGDGGAAAAGGGDDLEDEDAEVEGLLKQTEQRWIEKIPSEELFSETDAVTEDEVNVVASSNQEHRQTDTTHSHQQPRPQRPVYHRIPYDAVEFDRRQQARPPAPVPWSAGCLCTFLFLVGTALLCLSIKRMFDSFDDFSNRIGALLLLGTLTFIPGVYHFRIFVYAYFGVEGFNYDEIPQFN